MHEFTTLKNKSKYFCKHWSLHFLSTKETTDPLPNRPRYRIGNTAIFDSRYNLIIIAYSFSPWFSYIFKYNKHRRTEHWSRADTSVYIEVKYYFWKGYNYTGIDKLTSRSENPVGNLLLGSCGLAITYFSFHSFLTTDQGHLKLPTSPGPLTGLHTQGSSDWQANSQ